VRAKKQKVSKKGALDPCLVHSGRTKQRSHHKPVQLKNSFGVREHGKSDSEIVASKSKAKESIHTMSKNGGS